MYYWQCPKCGTQLELRKRVTITRRRCPYCNFDVATQDIDHHTETVRDYQETLSRRHHIRFLMFCLFLLFGVPLLFAFCLASTN